MNKVVLDSDIIIDFFKGKKKHLKYLSNKVKDKEIQVLIPTVVYVEVMVGYEFENSQKIKRAESILSKFPSIDLTEEIADLAAKIGRENKIANIGTVDLVIAATALNLNADVATENTKHFKLVPKLKLFALEK